MQPFSCTKLCYRFKIESKGIVELSGGDGIIGIEILSKIIKCNTMGSENRLLTQNSYLIMKMI